MVPEIIQAPEYRVSFNETISNKEIIPLARNTEEKIMEQTSEFNWDLSQPNGIEKPQWVIIGFQTNRCSTQEQNPSVFDHLTLQSAIVKINSKEFPESGVSVNFTTNQYLRLYNMFDNFKKEHYGIDSLVGGTQVNVPEFKSLYSILVFDVRKQSEKIKLVSVNIIVKMKFDNNVPAETKVYAIVISDRLCKLELNGSKLTLVSN